MNKKTRKIKMFHNKNKINSKNKKIKMIRNNH